MDIIKHKFGEKLKTIRKIKGFTQEKLSEQIGINLRQLARIEAGESFVSSETLLNICSTLEVSPSLLFDFDIVNEALMTGSGETVYFNVIKNGNLIQLRPRNQSEEIYEKVNYEDYLKDLDERMRLLAIKMKKDITIDELKDGIISSTKIFKPSGKIEIINKENNLFEDLKIKLNSIANDNKKLEFITLAFDSLTDKNAIEELKIFIKGMELIQN